MKTIYAIEFECKQVYIFIASDLDKSFSRLKRIDSLSYLLNTQKYRVVKKQKIISTKGCNRLKGLYYQTYFKDGYDKIQTNSSFKKNVPSLNLSLIRNEIDRLEKKNKKDITFDIFRYSNKIGCTIHYINKTFGNWSNLLSSIGKSPRHNRWIKDEELVKMARNFKTRDEFRDKFSWADNKIRKRRLSHKAYLHMEDPTCEDQREIYVIEFYEDKEVYVGLTNIFRRRFLEHTYRGTISKHLKNKQYKIIRDKKMYPKEIASQKEILILERYRNKGYKILNITKAGGLGGADRVWSKKKVLEAALECKNTKIFRERFPGAHGHASKNKYYDEIYRLIPMSTESKLEPKNIYIYHFEERKEFFISMTVDFKHKHRDDKRCERIGRYLKKYQYKIIHINGIFPLDEAKDKIKSLINSYHSKGYKPLNSRKY